MCSQKLVSFLKDPKTILNYYNFMAYKKMCFWKLKFMVPSKVNCSFTMFLSQCMFHIEPKWQYLHTCNKMVLYSNQFIDINPAYIVSFSARNNGCSLKLPKAKLEFGRRSFAFQGALVYNTLPRHLRNLNSRFLFKSNLKEFVQ